MSGNNCRVYTSYDLDALPEHPGETWTRFVCMSDTHSHTNVAVPHGDVLIHAGDLLSLGTLSYLRTTLDWLRSLPHELKIISAGNHDLCLDTKWKDTGGGALHPEEVDVARELIRSKDMHEAGIIYLDHEGTDIVTSKGVRWKIYGSPAAPFHVQGAFQYMSTEEAVEEWSLIPQDVEILLTHTPSYGVLDQTRRGKHAGCHILASRINQLLHCRMHVFGHIHEAHGANLMRRVVTDESKQIQHIDFISVNAAIYHAALPVIVDLRKDA